MAGKPRLPLSAAATIPSTKGFMPPDEGAFLFEHAYTALAHGPVLEIGSYCGLSALYLGGAALARGSGVVYTVDHHTGSEELQPGWEHHDPDLIDPATGRMNSLPFLLDTLDRGGLTDLVRPIVGRSTEVASRWTTPLAMVFIDGGHSAAEAHGDYDAWSRHVMPGGLLVIHDVFPDPADGGRPPYEIYLRALSDGYVEVSARGSMRALIKPR